MIELSDSVCEDECEKPASNSGRQKTWMPNAMVWDWQEREGDQQMCSVVIDLPSGVVNDNKNFTVAVTDDCRKLDVEMTWPSFLVNTVNVHEWLKNPQDCHPCLRGCKQFWPSIG